ncbi:MAG: glycosyltransferase, partial [Rhodospirillales bacterium]|nr:glycosyltransferase [Rhodospirillales bacterium]
MTMTHSVYIGFDRREPEATEVARASLLATSSIPLNIQELREEEL